MLSQQRLPTLDDLNIPTLEEILQFPKYVLRFFDDEDHVMSEDCECRPQIMSSSKSRSGLVITHNRYNLVPICSLDE
jgi:hypothetical protein